MLTGDDRGWRAGCLLGHREIEVDTGERLVEPGLMDLPGIRNALHRGDEAIACAESEIVVQVFIAGDIDLRGELATAGLDVGRFRRAPLIELLDELENAQNGMTGPSKGRYGFFKVMSRKPVASPQLGEPFGIRSAFTKRFPLGQFSQTIAQAAVEARPFFQNADEILEVSIHASRSAIKIMADGPTSANTSSSTLDKCGVGLIPSMTL